MTFSPYFRTARLALAALIGVGASLLPAIEARPESSTLGAHVWDAVPGEVVVRFRSGVPETSRSAVRAAAGASLVDRLPIARVELVEVGEGDVAAAIRRLSAQDEVLYAEPNFIYDVYYF